MRKLTDLKEWLTVADAAKLLAITFNEEDVTEADVFRLGLDGRLRLSVYFVNHTKARCGKIVHWNELKITHGIGNAIELQRHNFKKLKHIFDGLPIDEFGNHLPPIRGVGLAGNKFLTLDDEVTTLRGVWDLPMLGGEKLDVENRYQALTGGPEVTLQDHYGAYVQGRNGQICQLQINMDEEKNKEEYVPSPRLPVDSVIVVRTEALRELENPEETKQVKTSHDNRSDQLQIMNQASFKFWNDVNINDRVKHPDNSKVAEWLMARGFSKSTARIAASIIRPEWAPVGRKPEE